MKTIMVDMDNVITDSDFFEIIENYLDKKIDFDGKGFYLQDLLGDKKNDFFNKFKDMNLYKNSILLPNCYDVLKELNDYYKIYICTQYIWREIPKYAGRNLNNKYNFLYENLDFIDPNNYIFTGDKSIINCDIKIDDKIDNLKNAKIKLLFTAFHNKKIYNSELYKDKIIRVDNWIDIKNLLLNEKMLNNGEKILSKKL